MRFPPFLGGGGGIFNFCIKCKNAFISETVRDRAVSKKFLTHRVSANSTGNFSQKSFTAIVGNHLEFLRKMQKTHLSQTF